ncbi:hypothetical protein Tco_0196275 [Tanacetum coccineum]
MAQVQEAAKYYTEEDWDSVRAKMEANRDLSSKVLSIDFSSDDFAKKMVELINEKKRAYMIKYLKSQGNNWKMGQLKKLKHDELKEEFDKYVEKVEKFIPVNSKLKALKLKRTCINLPQRKGLQKNKSESARSDTEEDVEAYMDERVDEPSSEEFQMGSIPQGSAPAKIVKWPEEEYERVLWGDLKTMFDPPSTEDAVWSLTHQQKVLSWRYFHSCVVHCLTLEAAHIYMLTEVKYPLPSRVCQAMLEKRLIGDRKDEVCYQLLKLIERQAQQQ